MPTSKLLVVDADADGILSSVPGAQSVDRVRLGGDREIRFDA